MKLQHVVSDDGITAKYIDIDGSRLPLKYVGDSQYIIVRGNQADSEEVQVSFDNYVNATYDDPEMTPVRRCEFMYVLAHILNKDLDSYVPKGSANDLASSFAFYYKALSYIMDNDPKGYLQNLYTWQDMDAPITWSEVAYFFYMYAGFERVTDWNAFQPDSKYGVSIIMSGSGNNQELVDKLPQYKGGVYTYSSYVNQMRTNARYIPVFFLPATLELLQVLSIPADNIYDWLFREFSHLDLIKFLDFFEGASK